MPHIKLQLGCLLVFAYILWIYLKDMRQSRILCNPWFDLLLFVAPWAIVFDGVTAIADVFDAVSAKRCYREAMPPETCFAIIENGAGEDFDPALAALFLAEKEQIIRLCENQRQS